MQELHKQLRHSLTISEEEPPPETLSSASSSAAIISPYTEPDSLFIALRSLHRAFGRITVPSEQKRKEYERIWIESLKEASSHGSRRAMGLLGFAYEFGLGIKESYVQAVEWYEQAVSDDGGDTSTYGTNCSRSSSPPLSISSIRADPFALSRLAFLRRYGRPGVAIDRVKASHYSRLLGHMRAMMSSLSDAGEEDQNLINSTTTVVSIHQLPFIRWLIKEAKEFGLTPAQYCLGICFHDGLGVDKTPEMAVYWYQEAANQGLARGQGILGYCYGEGFGVAKNPALALHWYRLAAEKGGETVAMYNIGYCYEEGLGVDRDIAMAIQWYRRGAEAGNSYAQNSLGFCYEEGLGVEKDMTKAVFWYRKSAEQGYPWAQCNLGYCYQTGAGIGKKLLEDGAEWYRRAAVQGHSRAQHNYGYCLQNGIGIQANPKEAIRWYQKSAAQGNPYALHSLGYCFQHGIGINRPELSKALEYYMKAAEAGHVQAMLSLSAVYRARHQQLQQQQTIDHPGESEIPETEEAKRVREQCIEWLRKAAEAGHALAMNSLGWAYECGYASTTGVTPDFAQAIGWYGKAVDLGNEWAMANLGSIFMDGKGITPDYKRAFNLFSRAASMGLPRGIYRLGQCYESGNGTAEGIPNPKLAFEHYLQAAEKGYLQAMTAVGMCLEQSVGTDQDMDQALEWFHRAAARGDGLASERMREIMAQRGLSFDTSLLDAQHSPAAL